MQAYDAPDVIGALMEMLRTTPEIIALLQESEGLPTETQIPAANRIYGQAIRRKHIEGFDVLIPPKLIVVDYNGTGGPKNDSTPLDRPSIDVLAVGENWTEADRVRRAVWKRFAFANMEAHAGVCIYNLSPSGDPNGNRDTDLEWPAFTQTYSTLTAAKEVA